jgi:hypothetical protein
MNYYVNVRKEGKKRKCEKGIKEESLKERERMRESRGNEKGTAEVRKVTRKEGEREKSENNER